MLKLLIHICWSWFGHRSLFLFHVYKILISGLFGHGHTIISLQPCSNSLCSLLFQLGQSLVHGAKQGPHRNLSPQFSVEERDWPAHNQDIKPQPLPIQHLWDEPPTPHHPNSEPGPCQPTSETDFTNAPRAEWEQIPAASGKPVQRRRGCYRAA